MARHGHYDFSYLREYWISLELRCGVDGAGSEEAKQRETARSVDLKSCTQGTAVFNTLRLHGNMIPCLRVFHAPCAVGRKGDNRKFSVGQEAILVASSWSELGHNSSEANQSEHFMSSLRLLRYLNLFDPAQPATVSGKGSSGDVAEEKACSAPRRVNSEILSIQNCTRIHNITSLLSGWGSFCIFCPK